MAADQPPLLHWRQLRCGVRHDLRRCGGRPTELDQIDIYSPDVYIPGMMFSIAATIAFLVLGLYWFRQVERQFVDFL